jgi:enterochelin esterase family protein
MIRLTATVLCALLSVAAQSPAVRSPEKHADGSVTFRLRAPNAKQVTLAGEIAPTPLPMNKGEDGVWTLTTGRLEPDIYSYRFVVDGQSTPDPANPALKEGGSVLSSVLLLRGTRLNAWDLRVDVSHGTIHRHMYRSTVIGDLREFDVYTPPGYETSSVKYPVLFLLHGSGDGPVTWVNYGKANNILDNLIGDGKAKPMIVVMPNGHTLPSGETDRSKNTPNFAADLRDSIIPQVEKLYRTESGKSNRAIAGLSMGGGQSLFVGLTNLDKYDYVAGFSSAIPSAEQLPRAALKAPAKLLWIGIGKDDQLLLRNEEFEKSLKEQNIPHTWKVTEGSHNWRVWRRYLTEVLPLLFR